jgi:hypothetical protein
MGTTNRVDGLSGTERTEGRVRTGVLYCGGCNPYFDREQLFRDIAAEFSGICDFMPYRESGACDLVLLINGCQSECLMETNYNGRLVVLNNLNYKNFKKIISAAIDQL